MLRATFIVLALIAAGCSTGLSPQACAVADWYAIGYEDATAGKPNWTIGLHRADCAEHGIPVNFSTYMAGHREGVVVFCRPGNGYRLGNRGTSYQGVCPRELEPAFLAAHTAGYGVYHRRAAITDLTSKRGTNSRRVDKIDDELAAITARLAGGGLTAQERTTLAGELRRLAEERGELTVAIRDLDADIAAARDDLDTYRANAAARYGS